MSVPTRAWLANHIGVLPPGLDVDELVRELNRRLRQPVPANTVLLNWFEDANGALVPDGDGTRDMGSLTARIKSLFAESFVSVKDITVGVEVQLSLSGSSGIVGTKSNHRFRLAVNNTSVWVLSTSFVLEPDIDDTYPLGTTAKRITEIHVGKVRLNASNLGIFRGSGTPESVVTADVGSTFHRTDGGAGTSFYVKESGTGNTGWVAK